jgi:hypothetical protein
MKDDKKNSIQSINNRVLIVSSLRFEMGLAEDLMRSVMQDWRRDLRIDNQPHSTLPMFYLDLEWLANAKTTKLDLHMLDAFRC